MRTQLLIIKYPVFENCFHETSKLILLIFNTII